MIHTVTINKYQYFRLSLIIAAICILFSLGVWQLHRSKEKSLLLDTLRYNIDNPAIALDSLQMLASHMKVALHGKFLTNADIHLYRRSPNNPKQDGYYLLTPFQLDNGEIIMVIRGWFSRANKGIAFAESQGDKRIVGIALQGERTQWFMPKNDLQANVWFTLDMSAMSQQIKLRLASFCLLQLDNVDSSGMLIPIPVTNLTKIKNDHLEYAITWFALAAGLIVICIIVFRNFKISTR